MNRLSIAAACLLLASLSPVVGIEPASGGAPAEGEAVAQVRFGPLPRHLQRDARQCTTMRTPHQRAVVQADVFMCKNLSSIPFPKFYGPRVAVPRVGIVPGTTTSGWGTATALMGSLMVPAAIDRMKDFVHANDVPWPRKDSSTAKKNRRVRYNVYQIWFTRHSTGKRDAWKYGITKTSLGSSRPASQISTCDGHEVTVWRTCKWKWMRTKVVGWYRARAIEATYCARYYARKGHRPVGMKKCL